MIYAGLAFYGCGVHLLTFSVIPVRWRVAWTSTASVLWTMYMSMSNESLRREEILARAAWAPTTVSKEAGDAAAADAILQGMGNAPPWAPVREARRENERDGVEGGTSEDRERADWEELMKKQWPRDSNFRYFTSRG